MKTASHTSVRSWGQINVSVEENANSRLKKSLDGFSHKLGDFIMLIMSKYIACVFPQGSVLGPKLVIIICKPPGVAGAYPIGHQARGRIHPAQVTSPSQGTVHNLIPRSNFDCLISLTCMSLDFLIEYNIILYMKVLKVCFDGNK